MINLTIAPADAGMALKLAPAIRGKSAYEVAVDTGFIGTQADWMAYLYSQAAPAGAAAAATAIAALATGTGATSIGYLSTRGGAGLRTVGARLGDQVSALDFTTPSSADAHGLAVLVPLAGVVMADRASGAALNASYYGPGQVTTNDGNKRGKFFSTLTAAPASLGNHNGIDTSFNGDLSGQPFAIEHRITGAATLGQPGAGFIWVPEASPMYMVIRNASGWNQSLAGNDGRTGVSALRIKAYHAGLGGTGLISGSVFFSNAGNAASTSFLANPAAFFLCGDMFTSVDGIFMDPIEITLNDSGHDIAAIGHVMNFNRTNAAGAKFAWWAGLRVQSTGSQYIDAVLSASGKARIGIDLSYLDHSASPANFTNAALVLTADQRIYGNAATADASGMSRFASNCGSSYITYSSNITAWSMVAGGNSSLQVGAATVITTVPTHLGQGTNLDYISIQGSATAAPTISAAGPSADSDVFLVPKGAGLVRYGAYTAQGGLAINGYITQKDGAGNSRRIACV